MPNICIPGHVLDCVIRCAPRYVKITLLMTSNLSPIFMQFPSCKHKLAASFLPVVHIVVRTMYCSVQFYRALCNLVDLVVSASVLLHIVEINLANFSGCSVFWTSFGVCLLIHYFFWNYEKGGFDCVLANDKRKLCSSVCHFCSVIHNHAC